MRYALPLAALVLSVTLPSPLAAQDASTAGADPSPEPTLQETMDFLVGFLPANTWMDHTFQDIGVVTFPLASVTSDNCTLEMVVGTVVEMRNREETLGFRYTVNLSQIDPLSLTRDDDGKAFYFEAAGGQRTIPAETLDWDKTGFWGYRANARPFDDPRIHGSSKVKGIRLHADEPEATARVERALKHAVNLCGGRVSPF